MLRRIRRMSDAFDTAVGLMMLGCDEAVDMKRPFIANCSRAQSDEVKSDAFCDFSHNTSTSYRSVVYVQTDPLI